MKDNVLKVGDIVSFERGDTGEIIYIQKVRDCEICHVKRYDGKRGSGLNNSWTITSADIDEIIKTNITSWKEEMKKC